MTPPDRARLLLLRSIMRRFSPMNAGRSMHSKRSKMGTNRQTRNSDISLEFSFARMGQPE